DNLGPQRVGLGGLANKRPTRGKPISVKHEPDVRQQQRLGTTVPAWPRLKTTVPARAARTGHLFPGVIVGTSEHPRAVIVTEHASLVAVRLFAGGHGYHPG